MLRLRDGRRLAFKAYGPDDGAVVFLCHSTGGSRYDPAPQLRAVEAACAAARVRIIAVDRPGYGESDDQPGRTMADWASDIAELADAVGAAQFGMLGVGTGGGYALAVAAAPAEVLRPGRLRGVALVAAEGPFRDPQRPLDTVDEKADTVRQWLASGVAAVPLLLRMKRMVMLRWPQQQVEEVRAAVAACSADAAIAARIPDDLLMASAREGVRHGVAGVLRDVQLQGSEWGFALRDAAQRGVERGDGEPSLPIFVWHGEDDPLVPCSWASFFEREVPGARAEVLHGHGHLSIVHERLTHVLLRLAPLVEAPAAGSPGAAERGASVEAIER